MDSRTIRSSFFEFFGARGHESVPSSSLVPNDPTLLLSNAGMNQFKPYFLGEQTPASPRAMSVQKCFRTPDIDEVGRTAGHLTFFEMLGNFSFGDYYKDKACPWAWELVTEVWGIDPARLWVTIFETDDEAYEIWVDGVGVTAERVVRRGAKDNFWSMGVAGPCGPCSELNVDLGDAYGASSPRGPVDNEQRYLEIWNLVFMQNDCNDAIQPIAELPRKNIDTGAGLERLAFVLQDVGSVFETDLLGGMIAAAEGLTGKRYGDDGRADTGLRILADHGRGLTFLIADGVLPSNEGRGYVLRRIMRRAVRQARLLGRDDPVLPGLVDAAAELMGDAYQEVVDRRAFIAEVATREEERFDTTLRQGLSLLEREIAQTKTDAATTLPGETVFRLHDTFGFPFDLTKEIAADEGLEVDEAAFAALMQDQRERARAARAAAGGDDAEHVLGALRESAGATEFVGYEHLEAEGSVVALSDGSSSLAVAGEGEEVVVVTDRTPFYAAGGGQVGDRGAMHAPGGVTDVVDTRWIVPGLTGHRVVVHSGEIRVGDVVRMTVDPQWRLGSAQAHTATHILHWTLRGRLGEHASQAGSLVEPGRLRFDFNHYEALGDSQLTDISDEIQTRIGADDDTRAYETSYSFARSIGAMAIFGEKYGDFVRVVEVGDYSKELCGGTHVEHTSLIGASVLTSEGSVGANLRRVEVLVGREGLRYLERKATLLDAAAEMLKTDPDRVAERIERLLHTHKEMERKLAEVERRSADSDAAALIESAVDVDGTRLLVARRDVAVDVLRSLAQSLKGKLGSGIVVLATGAESKANLVGAVTKDLTKRGISARDVLAPGAALLGGGAGGKPDLAVSGGPAVDKLDEAIEAVARAARDLLRP